MWGSHMHVHECFSLWAISQTGPNEILKKIKGKGENLVGDILAFVWYVCVYIYINNRTM